ncbi:MAG: RNA-guided endonuclease InsQ/TnpB family protein [Thermoplasmata archaeon]
MGGREPTRGYRSTIALGYPRFRRESFSFSFVPGSDPITPGPNGTFRPVVPRLGEVPLRLHRPPPARGSVRTVTLRCEGSEWYATLQYALPDPPPPPDAPPVRPVGIDLGLTHLATLSNGETVEPPRFLHRQSVMLRRQQRRRSRKHRGSHRYRLQRERVARIHRRIRRRREWFAHQLAHDGAERFDLIAFEDLEVPEMMGSHRFARSIADAGWGNLRELCRYKAKLRSGRYVEVPSEGTTQVCSECGRRVEPPLTLSDRVFRCPSGHEADRDGNAARNVLKRGVEEVRRNTAEGMRGEGRPPPAGTGRRAYSRSRELMVGPGRPAEGGPGPTALDRLPS